MVKTKFMEEFFFNKDLEDKEFKLSHLNEINKQFDNLNKYNDFTTDELNTITNKMLLHENINTPFKFVDNKTLSEEKNKIFEKIFNHKNSDINILRNIMENGDEGMQMFFQKKTGTTLKTLEKLLDNPDLSENILRTLGNHPNPQIQLKVLEHENTPSSVKEKILEKNKDNIPFINKYVQKLVIDNKIKGVELKIELEITKDLKQKIEMDYKIELTRNNREIELKIEQDRYKQIQLDEQRGIDISTPQYQQNLTKR